MTVILFDPFGDAQFTRGHDSINLSQAFTDIRMDRVTEIHMDTVTRKYFIEWRLDVTLDSECIAKAGCNHRLHQHSLIHGSRKPHVSVVIGNGHDDSTVFLFNTYEEAIKYEVACLDELRRKGVRFQ